MPLLTSCDSLLLLDIGRADSGGAEKYLNYNPTCEWRNLPWPGRDARQKHNESVFNIHEPSDKYRLLYYTKIEFTSRKPLINTGSRGAFVPVEQPV
jgi:hypothetical protein